MAPKTATDPMMPSLERMPPPPPATVTLTLTNDVIQQLGLDTTSKLVDLAKQQLAGVLPTAEITSTRVVRVCDFCENEIPTGETFTPVVVRKAYGTKPGLCIDRCDKCADAPIPERVKAPKPKRKRKRKRTKPLAEVVIDTPTNFNDGRARKRPIPNSLLMTTVGIFTKRPGSSSGGREVICAPEGKAERRYIAMD
jgi:hypothetical protein